MRRIAMLVCLLGLGFSLGHPLAAEKPTLTIYTYSSFASEWGPGLAIKTQFEEICACQVNYVTAGDGAALLTKLRLEGEQARADIILGLDNNLMAEARSTGLLAPHGLDRQPPIALLHSVIHFGNYDGARDIFDLWTIDGQRKYENHAKPVAAWLDPIFVPFDYGYYAVIYDKTQVAMPPASLRALIEQDQHDIIIEDPRTSTPGLGLLLWIKAIYGEASSTAWQKLKPRIRTVAPSWSEAYGLFLKGEAPFVVSYVTSPSYHELVEKTDRYAAALFDEGHYAQIEVAAITKTSKQVRLAREFLSFLVSPAAQKNIPQGNWMFPVSPVVDVPVSFQKPEQGLFFSPDHVARHRTDWIREWQEALSHP